jgi:hypothetical protein
MHDEILNELERYLSGERVSRSFTQHLKVCPPCARETNEMEQVSEVLHSIRLEETEAVRPPIGFYSRVVRTIEAEEKSPVWGLFAPDLQFFRKVAFASLMLLAVLGSYLVSRESDYASSMATQQATLTEHNVLSSSHDGASDRDHMLVTLASYEQ